MKKLLCMIIFSSLCFSQLQVIENKPKSQNGFFFGVGLGAGANAMRFFNSGDRSSNEPFYDENRTYASLDLSAKVGGVSYFTQMIGLRYYYNLDLNFNPGEAEKRGNIQPFYVFSGSHTLNADAIFNVLKLEKMEFSVLLGTGFGVLIGEPGRRYQTLFEPIHYNFADFEWRFNLGTRVMFDQKYGLEFMVKIPVMKPTQIEGYNGANYIKSSSYYFTLDFVMERF